jgi:hypothetical protein
MKKKEMIIWNGVEYNTSNGSPFDRGAADSYYARQANPHWWPGGTYKGYCIYQGCMTKSDIRSYHAGYDYNEELGDKKDWG